MYNLSRNANMTWTIVTSEEGLRWKWDWHYLSNNPDLDFNFVLQHLEFNWDWRALSFHTNINSTIIENNIQLPWDWIYIARNKNLSFEFVIANIDKFDLEFITRNDIITSD